jgi:hypothetical protein
MNWLNTNFPNWRTQMSAIFVAICVAVYDASVNGTLHKSTIGAIIGIAFVGYFAKDKRVTGGNVAQTREAHLRLQPMGSNRDHRPPAFPPISTKGLGMVIFALLFSGAMVFTVAACGKRVDKIVNIPPGISEEQTQNWYKATGALSVVSDETKAATDLVVDLEHNGEIPAGDAYQTSLSVFGRISQGGIVARNLLYKEPEQFTESTRNQIVAFATDALAQLAKLNLSVFSAQSGVTCQPGQSCSATAAATSGIQKVDAKVERVRKALLQLQATPGPSHTDNTPAPGPSPSSMFRQSWNGVLAMRRAEGLMLVGQTF